MPAVLFAAVVLLALAHRLAEALDDRVLAERIREGDTGAFRQFFERYHRLLYGYLRRRGVPPDVTEDLIQNAFVTVWERRAEIDPQRSIRSYLFRICYTRALNFFRDTAKLTSLPDEPGLFVQAETPEQSTIHARMQEVLEAAVEALPERRRLVFELCFLEEMTYRETAEVLGVSVKTVENQMGHALKAVRGAMERFR